MSRSTEENFECEDPKKLYNECLQKQLDELDLLSSIYCNPGEIQMYDARVISDFHEYIAGTLNNLRSQLVFSIFIHTEKDKKIDIRIELPHLYPLLEDARISITSVLIPKNKERFVKNEIQKYISTMDKSEGYVYQVVMWIQDSINDFLEKGNQEFDIKIEKESELVEFERLWIYSHHIKNKTKRQEIIRQAKELGLTGFSRPGKPGVICVEGLKESTQEFWKIIKSMHWQKITIRKNENKQKTISELDKWRRFPNFKEELFTDIGDDENVKMDMSLFMKYLDSHNCGYIKKDLFGFD